MKTTLKILLPLLLIGLSASATDLPDKPFIHVTGTAFEDVKPDIAKIYFRVEFTKETHEEAFSAVNVRVTEILKLMQDCGIAASDIQSFDINTDAQRSYQSSEITGYRCYRQMFATIRNLEVYGRLVNEIHGAEGIEAFRANFESTRREEIEKRLLSAAVANSKEKAAALAEQYGATIGEVYSISDIAVSLIPDIFMQSLPGYRRLRGAQLDLAEDAATYLIPETIRIDANIHVIFYLKSKTTE